MAEISMPRVVVAEAQPNASPALPFIQIESLSLYYGASKALKNISVTLGEKIVTAFIGPSGCGKSTLLRCLNRMNDLIDSVRIEGTVKIGGHDIYGPDVDVIELRKRVAWCFRNPIRFRNPSTKTSPTACGCTG